MNEQSRDEALGHGASQTGGLGHVADVQNNGIVFVPRLAQMLQEDPFTRERERSLKLSLRNYTTNEDLVGTYLAIETDPKTQMEARYDVPVSPGDMTALSGDLYGSMENMRKAPISELVSLQRILDAEAEWDMKVASGKADPKAEPDFDSQWAATTAWRALPVYDKGQKVGQWGEAAGGDTAGYIGLALKNQAHFGQDTGEKNQLEIQVNAGNLDGIASGPQGNFTTGNEAGWMGGHARALRLAQEAHALNADIGPGGVPTAGQTRAMADHYGHETNVPETGLVSAAAANNLVSAPVDAAGRAVARSSDKVTFQTKLNDAYVENAGADHYLTDAFAAGHQIVRDVVGREMDKYVAGRGGRGKFLDFVVAQLQKAAVADPDGATGDLGKFQRYSKSRWWFLRSAAAGDGWLNVFSDGMKQQLDQKIDATTMHAIGAKIVHDYYNSNGLIVHNRKGMTFVIKGDGTADAAPEARQIIAMAVLESRTQITELAHSGIVPNPMEVWDYTPDFDKTAFTEANSQIIFDTVFQDPDHLWHLVKDHFSASAGGGDDSQSQQNPVQEEMPGRGKQVDVGVPPVQSWLKRRHEYVRKFGTQPDPNQPGRPTFTTADGLVMPGAKTMTDNDDD